MRRVAEWIGKTDDSVPPPHVRLRIFETSNGLCHISGRKIRAGEPWHCEHVKALGNGGENRESNLKPALIEPHKEKTARDRAEQAVNTRIRNKHLGIRARKRTIPGRKFDGTPIPARWK